MHFSSWVTLLLLVLTGCTTTRYTQVQAEQTSEFKLVMVGGDAGYLIDPRTETCLLVFGSIQRLATTVDCGKLKKSVPEAARYITWDVASTRQ